MKNNITLMGHRGWRGKYPENTMLGFQEVMKLDIDGIEMDVHMTKDHHIVVCHDADLSRTTDTQGLIYNMTLDEVRAADAGVRFNEAYKGEKIPTLKEFLELMATRPDLRLLLELKDSPEQLGDFAYASASLALSMCKEYGIWGRDRLTVITFSAGICSWIHTRYAREDFYIHGFYPKNLMTGFQSDDPYKYYDEVCLFNTGDKTPQGFPIKHNDPVVDAARYKEFQLMGIKPCAHYAMNTDEDVYRRSLANGTLSFTCDHPDICGEILHKLNARKLKK